MIDCSYSGDFCEYGSSISDAEADDAPEGDVDEGSDEQDDATLDEGIHQRGVLAVIVRVTGLDGGGSRERRPGVCDVERGHDCLLQVRATARPRDVGCSGHG